MRLDKNYKPPEGFEPVLNYREEPVIGTPIVGLGRIVFGTTVRETFEFRLSEACPKLPFKTYGTLWHEGWGIPTRYAVDADGVCWKDNAHGHPLSIVSSDKLLADVADEVCAARIRRILGLEVPMPA